MESADNQEIGYVFVPEYSEFNFSYKVPLANRDSVYIIVNLNLAQKLVFLIDSRELDEILAIAKSAAQHFRATTHLIFDVCIGAYQCMLINGPPLYYSAITDIFAEYCESLGDSEWAKKIRLPTVHTYNERQFIHVLLDVKAAAEGKKVYPTY
jgi:hypothetical protein